MCTTCVRRAAKQQALKHGFSVVPIQRDLFTQKSVTENTLQYWQNALALLDQAATATNSSDKSYAFARFEMLGFLLRARFYDLELAEPFKGVISKLPLLKALKESGPYRRQYDSVATCLLARESLGIENSVLKATEMATLAREMPQQYSLCYEKAAANFAQALVDDNAIVNALVPAEIVLPTGRGPFAIWTSGNGNGLFRAVSIQMVTSGEDYRVYNRGFDLKTAYPSAFAPIAADYDFGKPQP